MSTPYDVTIVGAGMAGLYAAWRLLSPAAKRSPVIQELIRQNGTGSLRICLLEQGDRVGGRLDSYTFHEANGDEVTIELGGMRFQQSHALVWNLVQTFGLPTAPFPQSNNRLFYVRGTQIWENEITDPKAPVKLPFGLTEDEQYLTPDQLFNTAVSNAVGVSTAWEWSTEVWKKFVTTNTYTSPMSANGIQVFNDTPYINVGFWNLLYDQVSQEGYRYLTEAGGYDSNTINWNSALAMPYVASGDYSPSADYLRLVGGYSQLPYALQQALNGKMDMFFNTSALGFSSANGLIDISVNSQSADLTSVQTKQLILALPKRSLELLDPDTPFGTYMRQTNMLNAVIAQPSFKLLLLFDTPWWQQVNIRGKSLQPYGPTITDLPLRMVWYFTNPVVARRGQVQSGPYWALLASYSDMTTEQFWQVMEPRRMGTHPTLVPTAETVRMALMQLGQVHGFVPPPPVNAVFKDWGLDPFGGGYHAWAAHRQPWLSYTQMLKPMADLNVYIIGEAYSLDQGWVEGALDTTESMLSQYFQIDRPDGVPADKQKSKVA
jgi:monoamine oxidase